jgi:hypothetical protein
MINFDFEQSDGYCDESLLELVVFKVTAGAQKSAVAAITSTITQADVSALTLVVGATS